MAITAIDRRRGLILSCCLDSKVRLNSAMIVTCRACSDLRSQARKVICKARIVDAGAGVEPVSKDAG